MLMEGVSRLMHQCTSAARAYQEHQRAKVDARVLKSLSAYELRGMGMTAGTIGPFAV